MTAPTPQRLTGKPTILGDGMTIVRTLPSARRRSIGAWCFLDHFGPVDVGGQDGLRVGPHPHIGLQTVTWLLSGEILHRDSLGSVQVIRPGQLNLMTSGCLCMAGLTRNLLNGLQMVQLDGEQNSTPALHPHSQR